MVNYFKKTILLKELATTIPIMEWIRDNGCPDLDHTMFAQSGCDVNWGMIVSLEYSGPIEEYIEKHNLPDLSEWFDYKGMKRLHESFWWIFIIGDNVYFATT